MKIKILGTKGEIEASASYHSKHSGILVDGTLLFDLGEKEFLKYKPKYIFITHLHPDHAFFIEEPAKIKIPIYAPERFKNEVKVKKITQRIKVNSYQITPIPTIHSKLVKSSAYLIQKGKEKTLYTGDMIWIDKKYHGLFSDLDLVITEGSFFRKGGMVRRDKKTGQIFGHTGVPNLVKLFSAFSKTILFIHFGSWFYKNMRKKKRKLKKLGKKYNVKILVGYDGMILKLNQW